MERTGFIELLQVTGVPQEYIKCFEKGKKRIPSPLKLIETGILEDTPSFSIDYEKELYYDFSSIEDRRFPRGGTLSRLIEYLGGVKIDFESIMDTSLEAAYCKAIIEKIENRDTIQEGLLKKQKQIWDIDFIMSCPTIGYSASRGALLFLYTVQLPSTGGVLNFKLTGRAHLYPIVNPNNPKEWISMSRENEIVANCGDGIFIASKHATFSIDRISVAEKNLNSFDLTEGEPDAITVAQVKENSIVANWQNNKKCILVPKLSECGLFYDIGAKEQALGMAQKYVAVYQTVRVYLFENEQKLPKNWDITDYLQDKEKKGGDANLELIIFCSKFETVSFSIGHIGKATFVPLTMAPEGLRVRQKFIEKFRNSAILNSETMGESRGNAYFKGSQNESIVLTTADVFTASVRGIIDKGSTVLNFCVPCMEIEVDETGKPGDLCETCTVFSARKQLRIAEAGEHSRWLDLEAPTEIELSIFPGAPLSNIHHSTSSAREYRAIYSNIGMQCSYQTLPVPKLAMKVLLSYKHEGKTITFDATVFFPEVGDKLRLRHPFSQLRVYGYWNNKEFVLIDFDEIELKEKDVPKEILVYPNQRSIFRYQESTKSSEEGLLRFEDTLNDLELYFGRIGYSDRNMMRVIFAAMFSGAFFGGQYFGNSLIVLGEPDSGKSFLTEQIAELFFPEVAHLAIQSVQKTAFRISSVKTGQMIMPEIMRHSGRAMIMDGYQPTSKPLFDFSDIDAITISGTTQASGILARTAFGTEAHEAATPLIILGNTPTGTGLAGAQQTFTSFLSRIGCENVSAGEKRFALIYAPNFNKDAKAVNIGLAKEFIEQKCREFFAFKYSTMRLQEDEELKMHIKTLALRHGSKSSFERRLLHIANLIRLFRLDTELIKSDIDVAYKSIVHDKLFQYASIDIENNDESILYYWHRYGLMGTPFARFLQEKSDDVAISVLLAVIRIGARGQMYLNVEKLQSITRANDMRAFIGLSQDEFNFEATTMQMSNTTSHVFREYIRRRGGEI